MTRRGGGRVVYYPTEVSRGGGLGDGSIPVVILTSCHDMKSISL